MPAFSSVDRSTTPPRVHVPRDYNAAVDLVDRHLAEGRGDKVAFVDDTTSLTYAALAEQVNRAGNALRELGVRMEQRVLLILQDTARFPALFLGAIKIGAVPIPVNPLLTADDYDYLLRDSRASVVVVSGPAYAKLASILPGQPFLEHAVVDAAAEGTALSLDALLARAAPALEAAETTSDDTAFWLYTSGSTGRFKGAVHLHADIVHTAALYAVGVLGLREDDRVFSAAKLFFAYGLGNALTFPLHVGATAILMAERPTPAAVRRRLVDQAPTVFCGVPTLFASLLADPELRATAALRDLHLRGRGAAARSGRALAGADGHGHPRRDRVDGDAPHLPLQPAGRRALRHHRQGGARLRDQDPGRARGARCRAAASAICG